MNAEKCIICGLPIEEKSVEHIIPEAIGGRIKINSVCEKCNKGLGEKIDCKLTEALLFQWIRKVLRIENRDGKIPTLHKFYRDGDGNNIIVKHGDGIIMPEYYDGSKPPIFEIQSVDNHTVVRFSGSDEDSIVRRGLRECARKGIKITENKLRKYVREHLEITWGNTHVEFPILYEPMKYLPCFVKIAYETMQTLFPKYSDDPRCEEIRQFLYSSIQGNYKNDFRCDNILADHSIGDPVFAYYAYFSVREKKLYMDINLFNKVIMLIPMSDDPSQYDLESFNGLNLFEII